MDKYRIHIWFILIMALYLIIRLLRIQWDDLPSFLAFYLTDLLFVPAMCCFSLIFIRMIKKDAHLTIHPVLIFIQVSLVSLYFEYYLPYLRSEDYNYTSDVFDVVMYFFGGIIFLYMQAYDHRKNRNSPKTLS